MAFVAYFAALALSLRVEGARPIPRSWDTVGDVMGMHADTCEATEAQIQFMAQHYRRITSANMCKRVGNATIEDATLVTATRLKAVNPSIRVGMYWRSDFALELAECSGFKNEWAAHPEWRLKDDAGKVIDRGGGIYFIDYLNPDAAAFFAKVLVNVSRSLLPSGAPVLDYIYIDGDPSESVKGLRPGVGPERSEQLVRAIYSTYGDIQAQLDAAGRGQIVELNGMDGEWEAQTHVKTGAAANMFDHWTILQFLNISDGSFNKTMVDEGFQLAVSPLLKNVSTVFKGWPGPIIHQRDQYPPTIPTPQTPAEFQKVAGERFNSELALFLLVAGELDYWVYSWFWSFYDYIPGNESSTVPAEFYPEAKCKLGEPYGPYYRVPGTWTYRRMFKHATVFVDLENRTASHVDLVNCDT